MIIKDAHGSRVPRRSVGAGRWVEAKIQPGLCSRGLCAQKECLFFFNSHKGNPRANSSRPPWASWNSDSTHRASHSHSRPLKPYAALPRDPTSSHAQSCYFRNSPSPVGACFFFSSFLPKRLSRSYFMKPTFLLKPGGMLTLSESLSDTTAELRPLSGCFVSVTASTIPCL